MHASCFATDDFVNDDWALLSESDQYRVYDDGGAETRLLRKQGQEETVTERDMGVSLSGKKSEGKTNDHDQRQSIVGTSASLLEKIDLVHSQTEEATRKAESQEENSANHFRCYSWIETPYFNREF